jgi:hypothetical protein
VRPTIGVVDTSITLGASAVQLLRSAARSVVRSADYSAGRSSIVSDWSTEFDDRSSCPAAACCVLLDAGKYIIGLPKKVHTAAQGQAAIEALILVADRGGPTMFARIGVIKALNSHVERMFDPSRWDAAGSELRK